MNMTKFPIAQVIPVSASPVRHNHLEYEIAIGYETYGGYSPSKAQY